MTSSSVRCLSRKSVKPNVVGQTQHFVEGRTAQVGIHHKDALSVLGEDDRQIKERGGFAFARARR